MKKFNKFLSVAVASAMVMAMAGCGNTGHELQPDPAGRCPPPARGRPGAGRPALRG